MTRVELALILGGAMLLAALVGWGLRWLWERLHAGPPADAARLDALSAALAEAEATRDALADAAAARIAALEGELAETERRLGRALAEREAELEAVMETVGALRRELAAARAEGDGRRAGGA